MEKKIITNFVHPDIEDYAEKHTSPENEVMAKLNRWTHLRMTRPRMLSGAYQGKLLEMISCMMQPSRVLEIGAYVGYSAICLAKGLKQDGLLHTIEADEELEDIIIKAIADANLNDKIILHIGEALKVLPDINEMFDLVFIDADKINYINYYEQVLPMVKQGGIIILDNILWSGKVVYEQPKLDKETATLMQLNDLVQNDPRVENILLPIRDGLMICRKI